MTYHCQYLSLQSKSFVIRSQQTVTYQLNPCILAETLNLNQSINLMMNHDFSKHNCFINGSCCKECMIQNERNILVWNVKHQNSLIFHVKPVHLLDLSIDIYCSIDIIVHFVQCKPLCSQRG